MPEKNKLPLMTLMGVLFTLIALVALIALLRIGSLADTSNMSTQTVGVENVGPTVGNILVEDADTNADVTLTGFTPYEATTHDIRVTATLHDDNGCKDIASANYNVHLKAVGGTGGPKGGGGKPVGKIDLSRVTAWGGAPEKDPVLLALEWHATPVLNEIYPNEIAPACNDAYITLTGSGFDSASVVKLDGVTVSSYYDSYQNFLYATLPAASIVDPGTHSITVYNPPLNGGTSDPVTLTVLSSGGVCYADAPNPVPILTGLSDPLIGVGCDEFPMTLEGSGFNSNSIVKLDGVTVASTFNSDMHTLIATIPATAIELAGTITVTVTNPSPVGGVSDPQSLIVDVQGECPGTTPVIVVPVCSSQLDAAGSYCYPVEITTADMTAAGCTAGQTDVTVTKTISVQNYASASDAGTLVDLNWAADIVVFDQAAEQGAGSAEFEVNSLAGFSTPGSIDYGVVALGAKSDQTLTFTNTGNRDVNSLVRADGDMTSSLSGYADIPAGNVQYKYEALAISEPVTTSDSLFGICLPVQVLDGPSNIPSLDTILSLSVPNSGVNGTYTNTLTLTAQATTGCEGGGSEPPPKN
ncbi:MAG: IPT/TIG domain-containing protein [Patescibacteria group bacterium]